MLIHIIKTLIQNLFTPAPWHLKNKILNNFITSLVLAVRLEIICFCWKKAKQLK